MKLYVSKLYRSYFIRIGLAITITMVSLYLAVRNISLQDVGEALKQADYRFVVLALISVGINTVAKAARWKVLIGSRNHRVSFYQVQKSLLIGHALNILYPGRIGDLNRAYDIGGKGPGRTFVLGTVALEKVIDLLSYAVLFMVLLLLIPLPGWVSNSGYTFAIAAIMVSIAVFLVTHQRTLVIKIVEQVTSRFPKQVQTFTNTRVRAGSASLDVLQHNTSLLILGFWSAVVWGTAILNNHLTLLAFDIHLPLTASLLILIALQAGISIPSAPGRFGIFEYICVLALGVFGIDQATAFSYGILLHAIVLLPATILGLFFFATSGTSRADLRTQTATGEEGSENPPDKVKNSSSSSHLEKSEGI